jgi:hypothetical protein
VITPIATVIIERIGYQAHGAKRMILMIVIVQSAGPNGSASASNARTEIVI